MSEKKPSLADIAESVSELDEEEAEFAFSLTDAGKQVLNDIFQLDQDRMITRAADAEMGDL